MKNRTLEIYNGGRKMIGNGRRGVYILSALFLLIFYGISFAQDSEVQKSNWLLGVVFKLENMRDKAIADMQKYEGDIQKCDTTISKSDNIVRLAQQKGNVKAEKIAREASLKAQEAKIKNKDRKNSAELNKKKNGNRPCIRKKCIFRFIITSSEDKISNYQLLRTRRDTKGKWRDLRFWEKPNQSSGKGRCNPDLWQQQRRTPIS